jgi:hypothetical protein
MRYITGQLILLLTLAGPALAGGEWRGGYDPNVVDEPAFYAKGCYWSRGVRHCAYYCYVEINGKHYCHERERHAVPQGDPYAEERPTVEDIYRHKQRAYR